LRGDVAESQSQNIAFGDREVAVKQDSTSPRPSPQEGREAPRIILENNHAIIY
jgi:hypothetical protein